MTTELPVTELPAYLIQIIIMIASDFNNTTR